MDWDRWDFCRRSRLTLFIPRKPKSGLDAPCQATGSPAFVFRPGAPRICILGNFQSSLAGLDREAPNPGLRPGLLSTAPPGLFGRDVSARLLFAAVSCQGVLGLCVMGLCVLGLCVLGLCVLSLCVLGWSVPTSGANYAGSHFFLASGEAPCATSVVDGTR